MADKQDWLIDASNEAVDILERFSDEVLNTLLGTEDPPEYEENSDPEEFLGDEVDQYLDDQVVNGYLMQYLAGDATGDGIAIASRLLYQLEKFLETDEGLFREQPANPRKEVANQAIWTYRKAAYQHFQKLLHEFRQGVREEQENLPPGVSLERTTVEEQLKQFCEEKRQ